MDLNARKAGIGGSDSGAVAGVNPRRTPLDVWTDKLSDEHEEVDNQAIYWGNVLENEVANAYTLRTGDKVRRNNKQLTHPDMPWMIANLDREVVGQQKILECKTSGTFVQGWGPDGSDQVPDSYYMQCTHYMIVTGKQLCDLAVLIGGQDFRVYTIPYDQSLADLLIGIEDKFWNHNVIGNIAPKPICTHDIDSLYARANGNEVLADDITLAAINVLRELKADEKKLKAAIDEATLNIKSFMGNNSNLISPNGTPLATWRNTKDIMRFDAKALAADKPDLHAKYLKNAGSQRRLLLK